MIRVGIIGGIGSGKSFISKLFEYPVFNADNEAKKIMKSLIFDLLVIDIMMPGQNGLEFLKEIRQTNSIPTLMLTAMSSPEDRLDGLEFGADDYLSLIHI